MSAKTPGSCDGQVGRALGGALNRVGGANIPFLSMNIFRNGQNDQCLLCATIESAIAKVANEVCLLTEKTLLPRATIKFGVFLATVPELEL